MGWVLRQSGAVRSVCMTLTVLALALKVLVPQGFMISDQGSGFPLVICTGHGALSLADDGHGGSKAPDQKKSEAPCTGAGTVTPVMASAVTGDAGPAQYAFAAVVDGALVDLLPGRGLAAPPPQSHAPPTPSI